MMAVFVCLREHDILASMLDPLIFFHAVRSRNYERAKKSLMAFPDIHLSTVPLSSRRRFGQRAH